MLQGHAKGTHVVLACGDLDCNGDSLLHVLICALYDTGLPGGVGHMMLALQHAPWRAKGAAALEPA